MYNISAYTHTQMYNGYFTEIIREILENRAQTYRQLGEEYDISRNKKLANVYNLEEGETDSNFVNYESPAMENHHAI